MLWRAITRTSVGKVLIREHIPNPTAVEVFTCGPRITKFDRQAAKEKERSPRRGF